MKYKVGDKVRIVSERTGNPFRWNLSGEMDKWLGKVMTVRKICQYGYSMKEDCESHDNFGIGWGWAEDMIAGYADEPVQKLKENKKKEKPEPFYYSLYVEYDGKNRVCVKTNGRHGMFDSFYGKPMPYKEIASSRCNEKEDAFDLRRGLDIALGRCAKAIAAEAEGGKTK